MGSLFEGPHLIFIAVLLVVLFGAKKIPELGKGLGEGLKGFKEGLKGINDDVKDDAKNDAHIVTPVPENKDTVAK